MAIGSRSASIVLRLSCSASGTTIMHSEYEDDVERIIDDVTVYINTVSQQSDGAIVFLDSSVLERVGSGLWTACEHSNIRLVTDEADLITGDSVDFRVTLILSVSIDHGAITLTKAREIIEGPVELFDIQVNIG